MRESRRLEQELREQESPGRESLGPEFQPRGRALPVRVSRGQALPVLESPVREFRRQALEWEPVSAPELVQASEPEFPRRAPEWEQVLVPESVRA